MPRNPRGKESEKMARTKRLFALKRAEFAYPSETRIAAAGVTSYALKAEDPAVRAMIDAAVAKRRTA
jgi:hypothetical protein